MPKFSALTGNGPAPKGDWCEEHSVPESQCVECNKELLPQKSFGWCKIHGVHDCPLEHPEVAQLKTTPHVTPADRERAQRALAFAPRPQNNAKCQLHSRRIQFASQASLDKQGIAVEAVWQARVEEKVSANGEIGYDQTRVASLSTPLPGKVWRVDREIGQAVQKDDVLALVDAADVGKAKGEFLQAVAQVDVRGQKVEALRLLLARGSTSEASFREAEAEHQEAQIRLHSAQQALANLGLPVRAEDFKGLSVAEVGRRIRFLGLPASVVQALDPQTATANLIPVKAPLDGVVVARNAVVGEWVDAARTLFTVADTRQMWLMLHLRLEDAKHLELGQAVRFRPDAGAAEVSGPITWISTAVDEKTRTVEVRVDLANPDGRLRANTFGTGTVILRAEDQAVVVPNEAVHWEGNCHVVFVYDKDSPKKDAPKVFHVRSVRPGARDGEQTEIIAGVLPGELIATKNSGVIRAELLKNNLGAG
jgi:cobalt-zinc-cadmium efflux system membrane fusion protein